MADAIRHLPFADAAGVTPVAPAPASPDDALPVRSRRPPVHPSMAESARIGLSIVAVASVAFVFSPAPTPQLWPTFTTHYVCRFLLAIGGILLCRRYQDPRLVIAVLWTMAAAMSASSSYLGMLRGDYTSNALVSIALCVGAAAIIPWGWKPHLVMVTMFMAGLIADAAYVHGGLAHAFGSHIMLTLAVCTGGAMYTVVSLDRARKEIERRQGEDEAAIDSLTRELEKRVRERTVQLEKANTDLAAANESLEDANRRLASINAELDQAHRELQGFTYSVSHDIRGALRVIGGQSHMLAEEHGEALPPGGRVLVEGIRSGTIRVGQLVDSLLALARVSRTRLRIEPVDLSQIAAEVASSLRQSEPDRDVEVRIQPGLRADGEPTLLRILLENLLSNAWKFTRPAEHAVIEVGAEAREDSRVFYVRDNGAGFDMEYRGKLFRPFEKLHEPGAYEGTGIGLSTVKRVIVRHGGEVWAHGEPGKGATFSFTLRGADAGT